MQEQKLDEDALEAGAVAKRGETFSLLSTPLERLLAEPGGHPRITPAEELDLARRVERGDQEARERMILANLRLVLFLARRYGDASTEFADRVQDGLLGLVFAVDRFDWRRGPRFSTYAALAIRRAIERGHRRAIRLSALARMQEREIVRAEHALRASLRREPLLEEVAQATKLPPGRVSEIRVARTPLSLDQPLSDKSETTLVETLASLDDPVEELDLSAQRTALHHAFTRLPKRLQEILRLRYGIGDGGTSRSFAEVGHRLGVTRQRAQQLERQALERLAAHMEARAAVSDHRRRPGGGRLHSFNVSSLLSGLKASIAASAGGNAAAGVAALVAVTTSVSGHGSLGLFDQDARLSRPGQAVTLFADPQAKSETGGEAEGSLPGTTAEAASVSLPSNSQPLLPGLAPTRPASAPGASAVPVAGEAPVSAVPVEELDPSSTDDAQLSAPAEEPNAEPRADNEGKRDDSKQEAAESPGEPPTLPAIIEVLVVEAPPVVVAPPAEGCAAVEEPAPLADTATVGEATAVGEATMVAEATASEQAVTIDQAPTPEPATASGQATAPEQAAAAEDVTAIDQAAAPEQATAVQETTPVQEETPSAACAPTEETAPAEESPPQETPPESGQSPETLPTPAADAAPDVAAPIDAGVTSDPAPPAEAAGRELLPI